VSQVFGSQVFGEVAELYDDVRPDYPLEIADLIAAYAGPVPLAVEVGAGTGKGTEVLARLGSALTCVEPDPRMAAVLAAKFPRATVVVSTFEAWQPPPGGVPLLACALAWHWLDADTRNQRAHDALAPGGTLAVFGHRYLFADPRHFDAVEAVLGDVADRGENWLHDDIAASGLWSGLTTEVIDRKLSFTTAGYLALQRTFSPFRQRPPDEQGRIQAELTRCFVALGDHIPLNVRTTLVLARR
jgi:SAM-dependent methyltransferase